VGPGIYCRPQEAGRFLDAWRVIIPIIFRGLSKSSYIPCSGLSFGTASLPYYDGLSLASNQDIVVVTINYRTNVFGFPSSPDLPITGNNLGFMDQDLAMKWVQLNIDKFVGDPNKVTIMVSQFFCN
jgi:hypothetical protein